MSKKETTYLFVYGPLKRGQKYHEEYLHGRSNFVGIGSAPNDFTLFIDALPFLVRQSSDILAKGELYEIPITLLDKIDNLVGYPVGVNREIITITVDDYKVNAWAYIFANKYKDKPWIHIEEWFE